MSVKIQIPEVGESVTSGVIASWLKKDGDYVERDETVLELETDKITMEIPSPAAGVLSTSAAEGDEVDVGAIVGQIDESAEKPVAASAAAAEPAAKQAEAANPAPANGATTQASPAVPAPAPVANGAADVHATPLAKKIATEHGVDLGGITGTGPGHRIREQDVLAAMQGSGGAPTPASSAAAPAARGVTRERMTPLRQRIAARLVEAQQTAAMLTTFNEADMSAVMALRAQYKESFKEKHGIGLGFMSFFVKAAVSALKSYPLVNAFIVEGEDGKPAIEKHDYQDISIAVSSPKGLVVPVLRDCDQLSFAGVEQGIKDLAIKARDGKLDLSELTGGTFTITNGGIFGSMMSTPILNPPQSAILGMHAINKRPVEDPNNPGQITLRPMMYLALSYDHRIVDGAEAVGFLVHIKNAIQDPQLLMLDL
ncbi:MAG: 2-oxoglutarate dehydrogenase complex dihydrolipoyllysine-residue succinyltransferase [Planctomycetota bacterium]